MRTLRRIDPLYVVAAALFVATVAASAAFAGGGDRTGLTRSASVLDEGPGGTAVLRRWLDGLGARTRVVQGDRFALSDDDGVLFVLGASEPITPNDVAEMRRFVRRGGTLVLATDAGFTETPVLQPYGLGLGGALQGRVQVQGAAAASTGARMLSLDIARTVSLGARGQAIARGERGAAAGYVPDGDGRVILVGSLAPFLSGQIGDDDNGRFALALAASALRSGATVAFDEYHHGAHPAPDVLALLTRTWPGRTLLLAGALVFGYVVLTGRRFGAPIPVQNRPSRSSLEHVRAFAGLVRRSGRGEIARERLRRDLRPYLEFSSEAREIDASLARPLRDADLLRTVRRIDELERTERT